MNFIIILLFGSDSSLHFAFCISLIRYHTHFQSMKQLLIQFIDHASISIYRVMNQPFNHFNNFIFSFMQSLALPLLPPELYSLALNLQRRGQQTLYLLLLVKNMMFFKYFGGGLLQVVVLCSVAVSLLDCFVAEWLQVEA